LSGHGRRATLPPFNRRKHSLSRVKNQPFARALARGETVRDCPDKAAAGCVGRWLFRVGQELRRAEGRKVEFRHPDAGPARPPGVATADGGLRAPPRRALPGAWCRRTPSASFPPARDGRDQNGALDTPGLSESMPLGSCSVQKLGLPRPRNAPIRRGRLRDAVGTRP
jgi:hypothetical protein